MELAHALIEFFKSFATQADWLAARRWIEAVSEDDLEIRIRERSAEAHREWMRLFIAVNDGNGPETFQRLDAELRHIIIYRLAEMVRFATDGVWNPNLEQLSEENLKKLLEFFATDGLRERPRDPE